MDRDDDMDSTTTLPAPPPQPQWQPLPRRARLLMVLGLLPAFAMPLALGAFVLAVALDLPMPLLAGAGGLVVGLALGVWRGLRQYQLLGWRLDETGLAVRRGAMWQRETRVPASRVQHMDIKRGPLQRSRDLATLIVHTAGTRLSTVAVPHLDAADAERLRDALSRQIDDVDD